MGPLLNHDSSTEGGNVVPDVNLTQAEADDLIRLQKYRTDCKVWHYPYFGGRTNIPLASKDRREEFLLDMYRGGISLTKQSFQNRARRVVILLRLCVLGSPHRNPDGQEILAPHLHVYREGFADKWAVPALAYNFGNMADPWQTLQDFMRYCNVTDPPNIRRELLP